MGEFVIMCGAYDENVCVGEIIAPQKAFVEEGTSLHYYESIEASYPNGDLLPYFVFVTIPLCHPMQYTLCTTGIVFGIWQP